MDQMRLYNNVYQKMGIGYCIVNSLDGYDEISLTGDFKAQTKSMEKIFSPSDLGFSKVKAEEVCGGTTKTDAIKIFDNILNGTASKAQTDVVVANAAFAIHAIESEKPIAECVAMARESIESRKALNTLKAFIEINS